MIPDFYLAFTDDERVREPRRCCAIRLLPGSAPGGFLLTRVEPPLEVYEYGAYGLEEDTDLVVLACRFVGDTLSPVSRWPLHVHVLVGPIPQVGQPVDLNKLIRLEWGAIYPTQEEARLRRL